MLGPKEITPSISRATTYEKDIKSHPSVRSSDNEFNVGQCTPNQMASIELDLMPGGGVEGSKVNCPTSSWLDDYYSHYKSKDSSPFLGINIGCNKAYDAIELSRMGMFNPKFDKTAWGQALDRVGIDHGGICGQKIEKQFEFNSNSIPLGRGNALR